MFLSFLKFCIIFHFNSLKVKWLPVVNSPRGEDSADGGSGPACVPLLSPQACISKLVSGVESLRIQKVSSSIFKDFIYLFLERGEGREKERERNINV